MAESLTCFACEREPTRQCPRCGRPYCDEHGDEFCAICLRPASGIPSFTVYRGSLLALLIGAVIALFLLLQPSSSDDQSAFRPTVVTPTAASGGAVESPGANATQPAGATPGPGTTPTTTVPDGTPAAGGSQYTVVAGDTLLALCATLRPALDVADCVDQVLSLNGLTDDVITIGQVLTLP